MRIGDIAADERQPGGLLGIVEDRSQVRLVAGVGQRVEHRDPRPVAASQDVADVARADEPGPAGDQEARAGAGPGTRPAIVGHDPSTERWGGSGSRPAA